MKPGELQRNISLLWFLHRHVTLKVHTQNFKMASRVSSIRSVVESTLLTMFGANKTDTLNLLLLRLLCF